METRCLYCNEKIIGRSDKKFCSDQCRNSYNNELRRDVNNYVRNINNILRKNRRILSELNPSGTTTVLKLKLAEKGFNFNYFTNVFKTKAGKTYYFCYEQGYLYLDSDKVTLVIKQEYVDN